jgi:hypothetical protein
MANPRDTVIADLNHKLEQFFSTGKIAQQIDSGVSAEVPLFGSSPHSKKLRAARDKDAPKVKALVDAGKTASMAATTLDMRISRVKLIAQENGFKFTDT